MFLRYFFAFSFFFLPYWLNAQGQYADKDYYLIDSLALDKLTAGDKVLIDSALTLYHSAKHDSERIKSIGILTENMMDNSWMRYNDLLSGMLSNILSSSNLNEDEKTFFMLQYANVINNQGYIQMSTGNFDKALACYDKSLEVQQEIGDNEMLGTSYLNIGMIYHQRGDISTSIDYYNKSMTLFTASGNKLGMATVANNIGNIYDNQGDIPKALEHYHKGLSILEELGNNNDLATSLNNIGAVYFKQGEIESSIEHHKKSLLIREEIGDKMGMAMSYTNIGFIYKKQGDLELALNYYNKGLELREEIGDRVGITSSLNNIGVLHEAQGELDTAMYYYQRSLKISTEIGDKKWMSLVLRNIGDIQMITGDLVGAKSSAEKSYSIATKLGYPERIRDIADLLARILKKESNYKEALKYFELYIQMRDSVNNEKTQKATIRVQTKYEFEKDALIKEQNAKEQERIETEATSRRDNLQYSIILIALLILFGGVLTLGYVNLSVRMAEGIIFFSFLILFEFLLVLADPYIEGWSGGAPGIKLLFNAGIAALIFPAHAFFEDKMKSRLVM